VSFRIPYPRYYDIPGSITDSVGKTYDSYNQHAIRHVIQMELTFHADQVFKEVISKAFVAV